MLKSAPLGDGAEDLSAGAMELAAAGTVNVRQWCRGFGSAGTVDLAATGTGYPLVPNQRRKPHTKRA